MSDPDVFPSAEVLKNALGSGAYDVFTAFEAAVTNADYALAYEWRYYNDGKSWFYKVNYRKKTVLWLSVWEGFFRIAFYFTEKHVERIAALDVSEKIKEDFCRMKPVGRLLPMIFDIRGEEQLEDLLKVVAFKKSLK